MISQCEWAQKGLLSSWKTRLSVGSLQHRTHSFRSCINRASLPSPWPARLFHQHGVSVCQGDHDLIAESCVQNLKPYLQPFVRYWSSYTNERRRLQLEAHLAKKLWKVVSPFFCQHPMMKTKTKTKVMIVINRSLLWVVALCWISSSVVGLIIWSTNLGCASVGIPDIRPPAQTISYTKWLNRVAKWCERWHMRTGPFWYCTWWHDFVEKEPSEKTFSLFCQRTPLSFRRKLAEKSLHVWVGQSLEIDMYPTSACRQSSTVVFLTKAAGNVINI